MMASFVEHRWLKVLTLLLNRGCIESFFFFFNGSGAPRDLPSSPPRPSPDLIPMPSNATNRSPLDMSNTPPASTRFPPVTPRGKSGISRTKCGCQPKSDAAGLASKTTMRSEEHTSELQSRLHLVCRLLLEKKK